MLYIIISVKNGAGVRQGPDELMEFMLTENKAFAKDMRARR